MELDMKISRLLSSVKRRLYKSRPALNDLDRKLEKYLNYRDGYFIECGANDGYSQSNTYFLEKKLNWRGLLVEGKRRGRARGRRDAQRQARARAAPVCRG